jgi:hypothetical protein
MCLNMLLQADELAAAAFGIGSGQVHAKQAGSAAAAGEEGVTGLYGLTPEEVDAAEGHLLSLVQRPGQMALPPTAGAAGGDSALATRLQQQQLQVGGALLLFAWLLMRLTSQLSSALAVH